MELKAGQHWKASSLLATPSPELSGAAWAALCLLKDPWGWVEEGTIWASREGEPPYSCQPKSMRQSQAQTARKAVPGINVSRWGG